MFFTFLMPYRKITRNAKKMAGAIKTPTISQRQVGGVRYTAELALLLT